MKNFFLFTCICSLLFSSAFAQNECDGLVDRVEEMNRQINEKTNEIQQLNASIAYYKNTLKLINSKKETECNDVLFKINKVTGNSNSGEVKIEGVVINTKLERSLQGSFSEVFDPQGNVSTSYKIEVGNQKRLAALYKDVPVKFSAVIEQYDLDAPIINLLKMKFYSSVGYKKDDLIVVFKNLEVDWR
ncbi:hypothetical protein [Persicobacter sp. CCB-QB2]|uniref:hypothetical protein n=1 Tax=Persicobacter sp. CCB-QB2 TaxID=1561025 RepID=UPI0006A9CCA8|nr:hypothetical protein [Persicobacter sp. CCB-QB2]